MEQVLIGGTYDLLHTTTTEYNTIVGEHSSWYTDPDAQAQMISTPGKLKNLRVELNDVPGTGTYTFTLRRSVGIGGWANTVLTCTIAAGGTQANDMVNEIAVAAGDVVCLECNPDAPDNARYAKWTMVFEGDNANESLLLTSSYAYKGGIRYAPLMGYQYQSGEEFVRSVCPTSGTIKNLFVYLKNDPGIAPDAYMFTLRIGGAVQPLSVTITADDRTGNDVVNDIAVSAGDILTLMIEPLNAPDLHAYVAFGMTFVADTDGESLILGGSGGNPSQVATRYNHLMPQHGRVWSANETERYQLAQVCVLKKLYMLLSGSPGAGKKYTFTVRRNGTSPASGLVVEIANGATTGNDTANTITIANDDEPGLMCVPNGTPTARQAYWGLVSYIAPPPVGWAGGDVLGVAIGTIAKINGVALADITKVNGVA